MLMPTLDTKILNRIQVIPENQNWNDLRIFDPRTGPIVLSFLNAHAFNIAWTNSEFFTDLHASDYILRDGIGIKLFMLLFGYSPGQNMNGTDLIPFILKKEVCTVGLYGTSAPELEAASKRINDFGCTVVTALDGFRDKNDYLSDALLFRPAIIVLAMGMPKQEHVSALLKSRIDWPCLIINGGAILDFLAGRVKRAPLIVRRFGCEWIYRLLLEPQRLWKRYILGNFLFIFRILYIRAVKK
ncbi:capsular biosynthesis protein CpsF [Parazoarcus communis]|uniref:Capsular biosynthesis protein CpsF n=1 Tax=Parazoarcus communis TaxID=41977 RepID=A0A2U8H7W9_9RHOO|nr:WecB/TagA/CpsF family glycosyltransferase [Parazoarcus communis]AWI81670.1 capsular biosynthesis protein CpsF [Parazoarcus communis]